MIKWEEFLVNLESLRVRIKNACSDCGRNPSEITLLPVTKNWPVDAIRYCQKADISRVGENRVQEAISKQAQIKDMCWELIGHLQSNKVNQVVGQVTRIQTLDSLKLIRKVQNSSERINYPTPVLLQVNSGNDPAKFGFSLEETKEALEITLGCSHLVMEGFMTVAPYVPEDSSVAGDCFKKLSDLRDSLCQSFGVELRELSMGMSDDLSEAIACGSTMIRVGTALFGKR